MCPALRHCLDEIGGGCSSHRCTRWWARAKSPGTQSSPGGGRRSRERASICAAVSRSNHLTSSSSAFGTISSVSATARHPHVSSHAPARPSGHGCEPTIVTRPHRTPASSITSRRTASSTPSLSSQNPASAVNIPGGRPFECPRRQRWPSLLVTSARTTGSVRGYSLWRGSLHWRLSPPSTARVREPQRPQKRIPACQRTSAAACPAMARSESESMRIKRRVSTGRCCSP
mmetsp:Transcript_21833/g.70517  ORF Transcript_21833/g.70517 Transcript_21833/m.70517 type:complete len:230 (-) Transcript_21833:486-1175(-)